MLSYIYSPSLEVRGTLRVINMNSKIRGSGAATGYGVPKGRAPDGGSAKRSADRLKWQCPCLKCYSQIAPILERL